VLRSLHDRSQDLRGFSPLDSVATRTLHEDMHNFTTPEASFNPQASSLLPKPKNTGLAHSATPLAIRISEPRVEFWVLLVDDNEINLKVIYAHLQTPIDGHRFAQSFGLYLLKMYLDIGDFHAQNWLSLRDGHKWSNRS
jgi:hypothetical protein